MTIETYTRAEMVRFAVEEAQRHGGVNVMLAILHVLRNRVMAGWGDWLEVVEKAPTRRGNMAENYVPPNMRTNDVRILLNRVDEIYTRTDNTDLTGGALFYVDQNRTMDEWFTREIIGRSDDHKRTAHIGSMWFFS